MKRKPNALLPLEVAILTGSLDLQRTGIPEFHGYAMAKTLRDLGDQRRLTAHGTLYRALERLETMGFLASRWEDSAVAASEERPRRRLYRITAAGETALAAEHAAQPQPAGALKRGLAPS